VACVVLTDLFGQNGGWGMRMSFPGIGNGDKVEVELCSALGFTFVSYSFI